MDPRLGQGKDPALGRLLRRFPELGVGFMVWGFRGWRVSGLVFRGSGFIGFGVEGLCNSVQG